MSLSRYGQYVNDVTESITDCVQKMGCQPILFIGSGLSKRFFSGPSWDELLNKLSKNCPLIDKDYAYYKQSLKDPLLIGSEFARLYQQWAWSTSGRKEFPDELFKDEFSEEIYIKYKIVKYLKEIAPSSVEDIVARIGSNELHALQKIKPHALITTNYDQIAEIIFPEYQPIIGQKIIQGSSVSIGEIFKIHGCVSDPGSLVLTSSDYETFIKKKKYLSAKLLTYFSEHPLIFVGYSASDPNIKAILSDIDEALPISGGVIPNVYILEWRPSTNEDVYPAREKLIAIEENRSVRINSIETDRFDWVFNAFASTPSLPSISPKLLRALLVRSYELVRHDIPRTVIEADFQKLTDAVDSSASFAKLFGLTTTAGPSSHAMNFPYNISQLAKKLGKDRWQQIDPYFKSIFTTTGINIKSYDNKYHAMIMYGKTKVHQYSDEAVLLLEKVMNGKKYDIDK